MVRYGECLGTSWLMNSWSGMGFKLLDGLERSGFLSYIFLLKREGENKRGQGRKEERERGWVGRKARKCVQRCESHASDRKSVV